jgi:hypothetical protein
MKAKDLRVKTEVDLKNELIIDLWILIEIIYRFMKISKRYS